jgi:hypothetical protein
VCTAARELPRAGGVAWGAGRAGAARVTGRAGAAREGRAGVACVAAGRAGVRRAGAARRAGVV